MSLSSPLVGVSWQIGSSCLRRNPQNREKFRKGGRGAGRGSPLGTVRRRHGRNALGARPAREKGHARPSPLPGSYLAGPRLLVPSYSSLFTLRYRRGVFKTFPGSGGASPAMWGRRHLSPAFSAIPMSLSPYSRGSGMWTQRPDRQV